MPGLKLLRSFDYFFFMMLCEVSSRLPPKRKEIMCGEGDVDMTVVGLFTAVSFMDIAEGRCCFILPVSNF